MTHEQRQYLRLAVSKARLKRFLKDTARICKGCEQPYDLYTPGCAQCSSRHSDRRLRRRRGQKLAATHCSGCGAELANRTYGCKTCMSRHWKRLERKNALEGIPVPDCCKWCSGPYDLVTPGCTRCRERARKRMNKAHKSVQLVPDT